MIGPKIRVRKKIVHHSAPINRPLHLNTMDKENLLADITSKYWFTSYSRRPYDRNNLLAVLSTSRREVYDVCTIRARVDGIRVVLQEL